MKRIPKAAFVCLVTIMMVGCGTVHLRPDGKLEAGAVATPRGLTTVMDASTRDSVLKQGIEVCREDDSGNPCRVTDPTTGVTVLEKGEESPFVGGYYPVAGADPALALTVGYQTQQLEQDNRRRIGDLETNQGVIIRQVNKRR